MFTQRLTPPLRFRLLPALLMLLLALPVLSGCGINTIPTQEEKAKAAWSEVLNQYQRRADLIPNLVETVKGYAAHEREVFEEITKARSQVQAAAAGNDVPAKAAAAAALQGALVRLNAVAEAYPDLKANTNFLDLQKQLADTENQISFARQYYNDAVAKLNTLCRTIPWLFFTGIAGVHTREFYEAPAGSTEVPRVEF